MMGWSEDPTDDEVVEIARAIGLDVERLRRDMEDRAIAENLDETARLADALGIGGTPAFVIGGTLILAPSMAPAVDGASLMELVSEARVSG